MKDVFEFNHIDKNLSESNIKTLLRSALRGDEWSKQDFIDRMKLIDEMIIDQTPLADRFVKKYNKKFI